MFLGGCVYSIKSFSVVKKGDVKWQEDEDFEVEAILDYVKEEVESEGEQVKT